MSEVITNLFGSYEPIKYEYVDASGSAISVIPSGAAGVDWHYISGVVLFGLAFYCVFRIIGGLFK